MHTDNNGHATFTVEVGPKSDLGTTIQNLKLQKIAINQVSNK